MKARAGTLTGVVLQKLLRERSKQTVVLLVQLRRLLSLKSVGNEADLISHKLVRMRTRKKQLMRGLTKGKLWGTLEEGAEGKP
jgi:hypothetical protein